MMSENMKQFEQRLRRTPLKPVPADWRAEILSAVREVQVSRPSPFVSRRSSFSTLKEQIASVLWPHPTAWAGLAAVWICVFALNFAIREKAPVTSEKAAPPSPAVIAQLMKQQRLYAELMGPAETRDAERPKSMPNRPRTQRAEFLV
jgi:hypothetical protein